MAPAELEQREFRRTLVQTLLLPPILLTLLACVLLWEINRLLVTERLVRHTDEVITQAHRVEKLVIDMETGTRGFLLTGDPSFLEPFSGAQSAIDSEVIRLERLVADNPSQLSRIDHYRKLQSEWRNYALAVQRVKEQKGDYEALVQSGKGRDLMLQMRDLLLVFMESEEILRNERTRTAERRTRVVVGLGISLTLILGLILVMFARRQLLKVSHTYERSLRQARSQASALKSSEERYRLLFESNPQPTWLYDLETLSFVAVNDAAIHHYGYSHDEFLSMTIKDIRPPSDIPALLDNVAQVTDALEDAGVWKHRTKDGRLIDVKITSHSFTLDGRQVEMVLANDVTAKLLAEHQLRELNEQLEQKVSERTKQLEVANQGLESFSYSVSHDLRAPLRSINGFSRILLEDFASSLPAEATKYLELVRASAKEMGELIDQLLTFSRIGRQALRKQQVETKNIVERVLEDLRSEQQGRKIRIVMKDLPAAQADPSLLKQVFVNLLSNALKYTRGRSETEIEIGATVSAGPPAETVYFVRDNGAGFDMRYAHRLFGVFQRLHRADEFEGTGVGLATTHRIITLHGGKIWAEAEVNRGATFFFTLEGEFVND
jgi:PAS domain S-box-containing protein